MLLPLVSTTKRSPADRWHHCHLQLVLGLLSCWMSCLLCAISSAQTASCTGSRCETTPRASSRLQLHGTMISSDREMSRQSSQCQLTGRCASRVTLQHSHDPDTADATSEGSAKTCGMEIKLTQHFGSHPSRLCLPHLMPRFRLRLREGIQASFDEHSSTTQTAHPRGRLVLRLSLRTR